MTTSIYANVSPFETRVAVTEDGRLVEVYVERAAERSIVGNLYKGRVSRVLPGMQAAFVDVGLERDAFLYVDDVGEALEEEEVDLQEVRPQVPIQDLLRPGQEILVQITRELGRSKGPRASSHITLPGRFLVLIPGSSHVGVSRRITDQRERDRLRALLGELPRVGGIIVRTAGEGRELADFQQDLEFLQTTWEHIRQRWEQVAAPALLYAELDLLLRVARDVAREQVREFWVDDPEAFRRVVQFFQRVQPELVSAVRLYTRGSPMFATFGLEEAIAKALEPWVDLPSGGSLVIEQTEALVVIDVNTGRYARGQDLEETVFHTNLEAAREIPRQLRLRNLGGIVVVDFIDMEDPGHRDTLLEVFRRELAKDRARTLLGPMGPFGLVQLTRKRTSPSLWRTLTTPCPHCHGLGRVKSAETVALELYRQVLAQAQELGARGFQVRAHPQVVHLLRGELAALLQDLRDKLGAEVTLEEAEDPHLAYGHVCAQGSGGIR
ncbi:MAG: Rne/Rng family ribonuclease [Thermoanaerobaculum sp.]|nr:Rne/Rng family ribonuclease [Thermoanaerobaculum sp.]